MAKRYSAGMDRLIGRVGTSRLVSRLHPHPYRAIGGRWFVGRNFGVLGVRVVGREGCDVRAPVVVLEPAAEG